MKVAHFATVSLLVLAPGCGDEITIVNDDATFRCQQLGCPVGYECSSDGRCVLPLGGCEQHTDCPAGQACASGACRDDHCLVVGCGACEWCSSRLGECIAVSGVCDPKASFEPGCIEDAACASGYVCLEHRCYPAHCSITGCYGGTSCDPLSGACAGCGRSDYPTCATTGECMPGSMCVSETCRPIACGQESSCPSFAHCADGFCMAPIECACGSCGSPMP